jgi:hypothetical protein
MKEVSKHKQLKTLLQQTINLSSYKKIKTLKFYKNKIFLAKKPTISINRSVLTILIN